MMEEKDLERNLPVLALLTALIFGLYVRLYPVFLADFPLNDGAFFVKMTEELLENHFILPDYTNYNFSQIPYAYPPLGFYFSAILIRITKLEILEVFRFLPAVISWLTIPAFYLLAKRMLNSAMSVSVAVITFALIPRSWLWMIVGGGLTRSFGFLFAILTLYFGYLLFTQQKSLIPTIVFFGLTALSHPEAVLFAAVLLFFMFFFYNRSKSGFLHLVAVGLGGLAVSSPWWITVLLRHGVSPFLAAAETGGHDYQFIYRLLTFDITGEPVPATIATLSGIGMFFSFFKKDYFLPVSTIAAVILIPRSGPNFLMVPVVMLASTAIIEIILPSLSKTRGGSSIGKIFLGFLLVNLLISSVAALYKDETSIRALSEGERTDMVWIANNTPEDSQFLVLSSIDFWRDPEREWFPYLAQRRSLTTLQGGEWLPDQGFNYLLTWSLRTMECLDQSTECLDQVQEEYEIPYTHIYLVRQTEDNPYAGTDAFASELLNDPDFQLIYDGPGGLVFQRQPSQP